MIARILSCLSVTLFFLLIQDCSVASGRCGFPGRLQGGWALVRQSQELKSNEQSDDIVGQLAANLSQHESWKANDTRSEGSENEKAIKDSYVPVNESSWVSEQLAEEVVYRCNNLTGFEGFIAARKCENSTWTGEIPQCAEEVRIDNITYTRNSNEYPVGTESNCFSISMNDFLSVKLDRKRRLYAMQIVADDSQWEINEFKKASILFEVNKSTLKYDRKETSSRAISLFTFSNLKEEDVVAIRKESGGSIQICNFTVIAFVDECGHPEVPINGQVDWTSGDTHATYSCDNGHILTPEKAIRTCDKGKWSGVQPVCTKLDSEPAQPKNATPLPSSATYIIVGVVVAIVAILSFAVWKLALRKRNRLNRGTKHIFWNESTAAKEPLNVPDVRQKMTENIASIRPTSVEETSHYATIVFTKTSDVVDRNTHRASCAPGNQTENPIYSTLDYRSSYGDRTYSMLNSNAQGGEPDSPIYASVYQASNDKDEDHIELRSEPNDPQNVAIYALVDKSKKTPKSDRRNNAGNF